MKRRTWWISVFVWLVAGSQSIGASDVQVAGSIDKSRVGVDEEVALTIRILGVRGNVQAPRLPAFQGFDSFYTGRTSQFTFQNGQSNSTVEFNYVLVPKVPGRFTLNPVEVWIKGKRYQTGPIELEVLGSRVQAAVPGGMIPPTSRLSSAQAPPVSQGMQGPGAAPAGGAAGLTVLSDENIFVKATVDKTTVYPGEQILLTYTLYTRYDTRYEGFEEEPSVSGFWIEDFPLERDLGRETVSMNGKRYVKAEIRKIALFPTAPAQYTIQPGVMKVSIREQPKTTSLFDDFFDDSFFSGGGFFAKRMERVLKPEPLSVNVRPFPETEKPKSFNGAVGVFRLSASVDKTEVKQNEPVTLKVVIEGEGNVETLAKPDVPELTGFKVYEGDSSSELFKTGGNIGGRKTFEVIFIPTESGALSIPPIAFSFFDPHRASYHELRTQAFPLQVEASTEPLRLPDEVAGKEAYKKQVRIESKDIRYIHEEWPSGSRRRLQGSLYMGLAVANGAGIGLVAIGLYRKRREELFSRDVALKRRKLAREMAGRRLKLLRKDARSKVPSEADRFLGECEKILIEYVCNKFNVSGYDVTRRWYEEKLSEVLGFEDPLVKQVLELYDHAAEARYGRGAVSSERRGQFIRLIEEVIHRVEKIR